MYRLVLQYLERKPQFSLSWFSLGFSNLVELEFGYVDFCGGRKAREPGEKLLKQVENQQQTQPIHGTGLESNSGHIGRRRALSPPRHPCSPSLLITLYSSHSGSDFCILLDGDPICSYFVLCCSPGL